MGSINSTILELIQTDDGYNDLNNARIIKTYKESPDIVKFTIDDIFIDLCGYSLDNIIRKSKQQESEE
jgi:hypothetical protein